MNVVYLRDRYYTDIIVVHILPTIVSFAAARGKVTQRYPFPRGCFT